MNPPVLFNLRCPYPGLRPFKPEEAPIFFGREEHVDSLLEKLQQQRFLAVVGDSGSGKSSLVRAGLIPALETGLLPEAGGLWRMVEMRPGDRPLARLTEALARALMPKEQAAPDPGFPEFLKNELRRGRYGLINTFQTVPLPPHTNLLVLADQFEEIFRYRQSGDPDEADAFVNLLLASAAAHELSIYVVLTMRSDYLGNCAQFDGLPEAVSESQYLVPRLNREQLGQAIAEPAQLFGGQIEPELVNRLIN